MTTILHNNEFKTAMTALLGQDPNLLTTAGLSTLLADVRRFGFKGLSTKHFALNDAIVDMLCGISPSPMNREIGRRIMTDPSGWTIGAPKEIQESSNFYANLSEFVDPTELEGVFRYHCVRDNLGELQIALRLSSRVGERVITVLGKSVTIGNFDEQLIASDQDRIEIRSDARRQADLFLMQMTDAQHYDLVRVEEDESERSVTIGEIFVAAQNLEAAFLHSESRDWVKVEGGGWRSTECDRNPDTDPDEVTLHIERQDGQCFTFKAVHTDPVRSPWLK